MLEKPEKVVTDEPTTNYGNVLNFARIKDIEVVLSYADGEEDVTLYEYIAELATKKGCFCTADDVRNGDACSLSSFPIHRWARGKPSASQSQ